MAGCASGKQNLSLLKREPGRSAVDISQKTINQKDIYNYYIYFIDMNLVNGLLLFELCSRKAGNPGWTERDLVIKKPPAFIGIWGVF